MFIPLNCGVPAANDTDETLALDKITHLEPVCIEPVGRWYEAYCQRRHRTQTLSNPSLESSSEDEGDDDLDLEEENEDLLLTLDPKEWKSQDHYAVLGLGKLRFAATDEQIKRAHKQKVLRHHPDKKRARGLPIKPGEEDYFTCVTKAYEVLGNPMKRRAYDSVDEEFDESIPSVCSESKDKFIDIFSPAFERNKRWSNKKNVPSLGKLDSSFEEVNKFYSFWYDFDSWREYSYLDEEEKEKGENREERRWIEKQNKAERQKRKKEEVARIRHLVDNAYACDPRIARFKEEEKAKKLAQRQAKKDAARARQEEEDRKKQEILDEERKIKEREEEEAKARAAVAKKEKEALKKVMRAERKRLRTAVTEFDFFASDEMERLRHLEDMERLADRLSVTSLQSLNESLSGGDKDVARVAFLDSIREMKEQQEAERRAALDAQRGGGKTQLEKEMEKRAWSDEETQGLIKAANIFPAGTSSRWEVMANFLEQHVPGCQRTAKEVLWKTKDLQKMDAALKDDANKNAFNKFAKDTKAGATSESVASQRYMSVGEQQVAETGTNPAPWTTEEQKLLEQALKTYTANTPERWEKIAECLPLRSKKDCMKRYKELVEMIRAKKAAQTAAAKVKK